jgi:hypothetical protein
LPATTPTPSSRIGYNRGMNMLYARQGVWLGANMVNAALITFAVCRIMGRVVPAFDEPIVIGAMLAAMIPFVLVVGIKTLHQA